MCSATQRHLTDLDGTYLCRVVQNELKERGTNSLRTRYSSLLVSQQPTYVGQLSVSSNSDWGMWVNDIHTTTIFLEREMFSASFNAKTNIIWWAVSLKVCAHLRVLTRGHNLARSVEINYDMIPQPGQTTPWQITGRQTALTMYGLPVRHNFLKGVFSFVDYLKFASFQWFCKKI